MFAQISLFWNLSSYLGHHEIPAESDGVLPVAGRVVFPDRVQEELFRLGLGLELVHGGKNNGGHLDRLDKKKIG